MRWMVLIALAACHASLEGEGVDAPAPDTVTGPDAIDPLGPWSAPVPVAITAGIDDDPSATGDRLELYFNRTQDIWVTKRAAVTDAWGTPAVVAELSSAMNDTTPEVTPDGLTMYLASNRTGTVGGNDIWVSTRISRAVPWGSPVRVAELSSTAAEGSTTTADNLVMVEDSDRIVAMKLDVFLVERASLTAPWGTPSPIASINTTAFLEANPMLSADRLTLYFDSDREGNLDLYVATRSTPTGAFSTPQRIVEVGAPGLEQDAWISPDQRTLYFTSDRGGSNRLWESTR